MGKEMDNTWYNQAYSSRDLSYYEHPETYWYAPLWDAILENIYDSESIADFGCGVGQFAKMCTLRGKYYARGIDFSEVAIEIAKNTNPDLSFVVGNLKDKKTFDFDFDVAVFCETMEHIESDMGVLAMVPKRKKVIITLPTYDYRSHVRYIEKPSDVYRYKELLSYTKVELIPLHNGQESNGERPVYLIMGERQ